MNRFIAFGYAYDRRQADAHLAVEVWSLSYTFTSNCNQALMFYSHPPPDFSKQLTSFAIFTITTKILNKYLFLAHPSPCFLFTKAG